MLEVVIEFFERRASSAQKVLLDGHVEIRSLEIF
jgi:hypothetical protein